MAGSAQSIDRVYVRNAIKTLATNIHFASLDTPVKTMVVTSSIPNEGKSTIAISLAESMVGSGHRALLIECDMRRRSIANMLGIHARKGLYAVLSRQVSLKEAVVKTDTEGLDFLDCEPHIPSPVDILQSKRFRNFVSEVGDEYDFVVFDTPPLSAFIDAAVIGSNVDGCVLVVRRNFTKRDEIVNAYEQLKKAGGNVLGTVLNFCEGDKSEYYYEYYTKGGRCMKRPEEDEDLVSAADIEALNNTSIHQALRPATVSTAEAPMPKRRSAKKKTSTSQAKASSAKKVSTSARTSAPAKASVAPSIHDSAEQEALSTLKPLTEETAPASEGEYYTPRGYDEY